MTFAPGQRLGIRKQAANLVSSAASRNLQMSVMVAHFTLSLIQFSYVGFTMSG